MSREFVNWAVNDADKRGELKTDTDVSSSAETLLVVRCGVSFYAGYLQSYQKMQAVTDTLRNLLLVLRRR
jgi:TetR/AcrR family transcriptional repressor of uid operon